MEGYQMPQEGHYGQRQPQQPPQQQQPQQQQQQQQWPPHLLPPSHSHSQQPFPSPPPSEHSGHYTPFYPAPPQPQERSTTAGQSLSLNLSSLSVASPTNLSPINGPSSALSPVTPISPSTNPFTAQGQQGQSPFQFDPNQSSSGQQDAYDEHGNMIPPGSSAGYDNRRTPGPSRSSTASSSSQLPRKRSFTGGTVEDNMYEDAMEGYDDVDVRSAYPSGAGGDGSGSTSGAEDSGTAIGGAGSGGVQMGGNMGGSMNVLGKPMAVNNFVTKLYQMINDPKSAHFISWTELGTSFVVSNVGEFSRSILGSHFKHNNFSSFVRQLNMYGFHKINRTPRAQRTSTDAQTWEFSHHKFLRARPDLLDEIKRKALEPDPALKHRVELPGEVAAQLGAMRDENRRMWEQLSNERRRTEKLVGVVNRLWDVVGKAFPGSVPPFPNELMENESPNIYITSPTAHTSRYPPPMLNTSSQSLASYHSISPNSSPTAADFPQHISQHHQQQQHTHAHQHPHSLSRQHSFQHVSFSRAEGNSSSPLPPSPGSMTMDLFDDSCEPSPTGRVANKRQRLSNDDGIGMNGPSSAESLSLMSSVSSPGTGPTGPGLAGLTVPGKKSSRARSDSAPLGYGFTGLGAWQPGVGNIAGRPRSGSGLGPRNIHVPNIGAMSRNNGPPMLSISTVPSDPSNR